MKLVQLFTLFTLLFATSARSQQTLLAQVQSQAFQGYLKGVALSCGQSMLSTKVLHTETVALTEDLIKNAISEEPTQEQLNDQKALEAFFKQQDDAWQAKKEACLTALKKDALKLACIITAYALLTTVQYKLPNTTLYQPTSTKELAATYLVPLLIAKLVSRAVYAYCPPQSRAVRWLCLLMITCINYAAMVQLYAYLQPYTMPTLNQHLFNFTGNYLAPNVCCQLVS